jgi:hypothetical protein
MSVKINRVTSDQDSKEPDNQHVSPSLRMVRKDGDIFYIQQSGEIIKVPGPGPANSLVRSGNLVPFSRESDSQ